MEHRKSGDDMNPVKNIFADMPDSRKDELIEAILQAPGLRIERIVSHGQSSPDGFWYDRVEWTDPDQETVWLAVHYK